jgi:serine/threonine protein kinase
MRTPRCAGRPGPPPGPANGQRRTDPEELTPFIVKQSDFELGPLIEQDTFAEVYKAKDLRTGRECAVKRLIQTELYGRSLISFIRKVGVLAECNCRFVTPFRGGRGCCNDNGHRNTRFRAFSPCVI